MIRARSMVKLSRTCEALPIYEYLRSPPGTPEAAEFQALEELLRQRSGPGPYPVRLAVELADRENLELISATVRFDMSPEAQMPPLATSFQGGCHLARLDVSIQGIKHLWGYKFEIRSQHSFDAESVAVLRAVVVERPGPRYVELRYEDVPRARPK